MNVGDERLLVHKLHEREYDWLRTENGRTYQGYYEYRKAYRAYIFEIYRDIDLIEPVRKEVVESITHGKVYLCNAFVTPHWDGYIKVILGYYLSI